MKRIHCKKYGVSTISLTGAASLLLLTANPAQAVDAIWNNGAADANWQTSANWSASPLPGATSGYSSTDTATFSMAGADTINLGNTVNIKNILFGVGGGNAGAFTIGDANDTLNLTSGGSILVNGGVEANETIGTAGGSVNLSNVNNSTYSLINNGSGGVTVAGAVTSNQASTFASTLTLGGVGNGTISGGLSGSGGAGNAGLGIFKNGSGTWVLSGANSYTGATKVYGGKLVLDYTTNDPISATSPVSVIGGSLVIKGKSSSVTTETISNLGFGTIANTVNTLTLDANNGPGVHLTITSFDSASSSVISNLIDYSSSSGNSVAVTGITANVAVVNGVLMSGLAASSRAVNIVKDSTGYGFATLSGATGGTIGRLTAGTELTASNTGNTSNYRLTTAGKLTRSAALDFNTLTIDSSAGAVTLAMGANNISNSGFGRGILVSGNNNVSIEGTGGMGASVFIYNYSTGVFSLSLNSPTAAMMLGGTGFTDYSGTIGTSLTTGLVVGGGVVRVSKAQNLAVGNNTQFVVSGGGVLEIGADLNGAAAGDFTNAQGIANGNIQFIGDSGLSASGANRVVNFGGASAQRTWGASGFLTNVDKTTDGGYTLLLSSEKSDATIEIQNAIALGTNTSRVVQVANGSAATDAILSGTLSGSGATLVKTGAGTLSLTGSNTYSGGTTIREGKLAVNGSISSAVTVNSGGILGGSGTVGGAVSVNSGGHFSPGNSISSTFATGALTLAAGSFTDIELGNSTGSGTRLDPYNSDRTAVTGALSLNGTLSLIDNNDANGNGHSAAGSYQVFTQSGLASGSFSAVNNIAGYHAKVDTSVSGSVFVDNYQIASAGTLPTTVNLGITHVGQGFTNVALSIQNTSASNGYAEGLNATQGGTFGSATFGGSNVSNLAGGATSTDLTVGLSDTSTAGLVSGIVAVDFASNGTNSGYGDTALDSQGVEVVGQVNEYAQPTLTFDSGVGALLGSGTSYTLNLGSFALESGSHTAIISLNNILLALDATYQDDLGGTFDVSGLGISFDGLVSDVWAGSSQNLTVTFDTTGLAANTYTGLIQFNSTSVNLSGTTSRDVINVALAYEVVPEPATWSMIVGGIGMMVFVQRSRRRMSA